jgi:hypothetical protein
MANSYRQYTLPLTLFYSVGQVLAMLLTSKLHIPPVFVLFLGGTLQIISFSLQSFVPYHSGAGKYGCEILAGTGFGTNIGLLVQVTPQLIRGKDQGKSPYEPHKEKVSFRQPHALRVRFRTNRYIHLNFTIQNFQAATYSDWLNPCYKGYFWPLFGGSYNIYTSELRTGRLIAGV